MLGRQDLNDPLVGRGFAWGKEKIGSEYFFKTRPDLVDTRMGQACTGKQLRAELKAFALVNADAVELTKMQLWLFLVNKARYQAKPALSSEYLDM